MSYHLFGDVCVNKIYRPRLSLTDFGEYKRVFKAYLKSKSYFNVGHGFVVEIYLQNIGKEESAVK